MMKKILIIEDDPAITGTWALLHWKNSTDKIMNHIRRKSLNSSEFICKIVKLAFFIALKLLTPVNSPKKGQI